MQCGQDGGQAIMARFMEQLTYGSITMDSEWLKEAAVCVVGWGGVIRRNGGFKVLVRELRVNISSGMRCSEWQVGDHASLTTDIPLQPQPSKKQPIQLSITISLMDVVGRLIGRC